MTPVSVLLEYCAGLVFSGSWKTIDGEVSLLSVNQWPRQKLNGEATCYRRPFSRVTTYSTPHYYVPTTSDHLVSWARGSLMSMYLYGLPLSVHAFRRHYADAPNQIILYPILSFPISPLWDQMPSSDNNYKVESSLCSDGDVVDWYGFYLLNSIFVFRKPLSSSLNWKTLITRQK